MLVKRPVAEIRLPSDCTSMPVTPLIGRGDFGIVKIQLCGFHFRFRHQHRRFLRFQFGLSVIARLFAYHPLFEQLFDSRPFGFGPPQLCLGLGQVGLGIVEPGLVFLGIDFKQNVSLSDFAAFDIIFFSKMPLTRARTSVSLYPCARAENSKLRGTSSAATSSTFTGSAAVLAAAF